MSETVSIRIRDDKVILFHCPTKVARSRADYALQKEPGTIAWIDSFEPGAVFWDVGANIGVYSLYAALAKDCLVAAFEPGAANYHGLNVNIRLNGLDRRIQAFCLCLDDVARADFLNMQDPEVGGSLHNFGDNIDYKGERFAPSMLQGALSLTADELVTRFRLQFPSYIKIDVDGIERRIVRGARALMRDQRLKSVLVEVNLDDLEEVAEISDLLEEAGLKRDDSVPGNEARRVETARIYNLIYRR